MCSISASPTTILYLALEYFPCGSLRERLKHPVSEADAVNYAHQIGEALQIVHAARVVHRDLKPSNLMLTNDNRLVLIDFGSARTQFAPSDLSRSERLHRNALLRVSRSRSTNRDPDARGDLYSLGVVLLRDADGCAAVHGQDARGDPGGAPFSAAAAPAANICRLISRSSTACWPRTRRIATHRRRNFSMPSMRCARN